MCEFNMNLRNREDDEPENCPGGSASQVLATLIRDCRSASEALRRGDLTTAMARAHAIHNASRRAGYRDIQDAVSGLEHAIFATAEGRPNGIGVAFDGLIRALEQRRHRGSPDR